jgi:phosphomannomutase
MDKIKFGTDGWRGVIGDDFTLANVRRVAAAIAEYVKAEGEPAHGLIVGYDTRFLSAECAQAAAEVVAASGVPVTLADCPTPTPAVSYAVVYRQTAGAIVVTASHNPYRWNGIKFKAPYGGSAAPAIIARIERHLRRLRSAATLAASAKKRRLPRPDGVSGEAGATSKPRRGKSAVGLAPSSVRAGAGAAGSTIQTADLIAPYLRRLRNMIHLESIRASGRRFVLDPMYGTAQGCIARLFQEAGIPYREIHADHNPLFPGLNPEPIEPHVSGLRTAVLDGHFDAGFATDGDADRLGAIDRDGTFIDSHKIFSILLKHLVEDRGLRGEVVKTFSTTRMIDKLARKYSLPLHVTPIGFKYICELMLKRDILIGGEESGGIGLKGHLPERDGILNSLLLAEVMAEKRRTLGELVEELSEEFGPHCYDRVDLEIERQAIERLMREVRQLKSFAGCAITSVDELDGFKMLFGDSAWLLVRASGTENVLRLYAEAPSRQEVKALLDAVVGLAREKAADRSNQ